MNNTGNAAALVAEWQDIRKRQAALVETLTAEDGEPSELVALAGDNEALCVRISECTPKSQQDAAAMLDWVTQDCVGTIYDPMHLQATTSVAEFLRSAA